MSRHVQDSLPGCLTYHLTYKGAEYGDTHRLSAFALAFAFAVNLTLVHPRGTTSVKTPDHAPKVPGVSVVKQTTVRTWRWCNLIGHAFCSFFRPLEMRLVWLMRLRREWEMWTWMMEKERHKQLSSMIPVISSGTSPSWISFVFSPSAHSPPVSDNGFPCTKIINNNHFQSAIAWPAVKDHCWHSSQNTIQLSLKPGEKFSGANSVSLLVGIS